MWSDREMTLVSDRGWDHEEARGLYGGYYEQRDSTSTNEAQAFFFGFRERTKERGHEVI